MRKAMLIVGLTLLLLPGEVAPKDTGIIKGRVSLEDGRTLPGVRVTIDETALSTFTDSRGRFKFARLSSGTYSLTYSWRDHTFTRSDVVVDAGSTTALDESVDWEIGLFEQVTVTVSRRPERIVDAPAAVTVISEDAMERQAAHGQVPKLVEFTPGVDITQISMVEFLVNTRGFNSSLNRRLAVHVDGRDLTDPFGGAMEWAIVGYPLDDFDNVELVRGPAAALYGANSTGGIFNLTTKHPRDSQGGVVRLAAGSRASANADMRWAGPVGGEWYAKVAGGLRRTDGFSVSRQFDTEYSKPCTSTGEIECLPLDTIPFPQGEQIDIAFGNLRLDKYFSNGSVFTIEGGTTEYEGPIFFISTGRGQINDVKRPWGRVNFSGKHWNVLANHSRREASTTNLNSANPFRLDADNLKLEAQTNWDFAGDRLRLVAGASYIDETIESNVTGGPQDVDDRALFGQLDWNVGRHVKLVGALRWDDGTLFDARISPKGAVVYNVNPMHSVRLTYGQAFQLPTYLDFFLRFPLPSSTNTTPLNDICMQPPYNIDCGLAGPSRNYVYGNEALEVEKVTTLELGYKGVVANKGFVTIDYWKSQNDKFVTNPLPQVTPSGRTNAGVAQWVGPPAAETTPINPADCPAPNFAGGTVADCVRATPPGALPPPGFDGQLTNFGGSSVIALLSFANFGKVDTQGVDAGLGYYLGSKWRLSFSYSWFDFELRDDSGGESLLLLPNAPDRKASAGLAYVADRWDASLRGRWVDEFFWANGTYAGTVDSFTTVDLVANYVLTDNWKVGVNVANLFDDQHWEGFGGDLIRRRALVQVAFSW